MTTKYLDSNGLTYLLAALRPSTAPANLGTASAGSSKQFAKADHVHKMPTASDVGALPSSTTIPTANSTATNIKMDGTQSAGSLSTFAKADHVHPSDTTKVDKVSGKGLSTNDYTTTEKNKLAGIAAGAEVNQNAFSNVKVGTTTVAADGKTDTLELAAGSNVTLTPDATNDKVTIAVTVAASDIAAVLSTGSDATLETDLNNIGTDLNTLFNNKANSASPHLSGVPTAPTAAAGTNTTQIATTAFVKAAVDAATTGAVAYQGVVDGTFAPTNYTAGWYWIVQTAGTYAGQVCEAGDMIFCSTSASTYSAANFDVIQTNLDITSITNSEIDTIVAA